MTEDNFNIFEFFRLIYIKKIIILLSITIFTISGFFIKSIYEKKLDGKIIVHPLSLIDFQQNYINFHKVDNSNKMDEDHMVLREYTPLTLFFSFLAEVKNQKLENNFEKINIEFNFLGGTNEIYIMANDYEDREKIKQDMKTLLDKTNEVLLERLRNNLIEDLYLIVEAINNKTENIKPLELKKIIINKNLKKIENMKLVYFDVRGLAINRNIFNSNKFVILMGLLGFVVGIIIALTVTYFSNTKSN